MCELSHVWDSILKKKEKKKKKKKRPNFKLLTSISSAILAWTKIENINNDKIIVDWNANVTYATRTWHTFNTYTVLIILLY